MGVEVPSSPSSLAAATSPTSANGTLNANRTLAANGTLSANRTLTGHECPADFMEKMLPHVDMVMMQQDSGARLVKHVHSFFDNYTVILQRFSNELAEAANKERSLLEAMPRPDKMQSCWNSWLTFFNNVGKVASSHATMVDDMILVCLKPLSAFAKETEAHTHEANEQVDAIMKQIKDVSEELSQEKELCSKQLQALSKRKKSLKGKYVKQKDKSLQAIEAYKSKLRGANERLRRIRARTIPSLVSNFHAQESERVIVLKQILTQYGNLEKKLAKNVVTCTEKVQEAAHAVDRQTDLSKFVDYCSSSRGNSPFGFIRDFSYELATPQDLWPQNIDANSQNTPIMAPSPKGSKSGIMTGSLTFAFTPCRLFGFSLTEVMDFQKEVSPATNTEYPFVLDYLATCVKKNDGHKAEGIFRVSAAVEEIQALRDQIESSNYCYQFSTPHVPANLLKYWLRELSDPLIPQELGKEALKIGQTDPETLTEPSVNIQRLMKKLPKLNVAVIKVVISLAHLVTENEASNRMNLHALAVVFAPSFFRSEGGAASYEMVKESKIAEKFLVILLQHYSYDPSLLGDLDASAAPIKKKSKKSLKTKEAEKKAKQATLKAEEPPPTPGSKEEKKAVNLTHIRDEIISTEKTYVASLGRVVEFYVGAIKAYMGFKQYGITEVDAAALTSSLETLNNFHINFLSDLELSDSDKIPGIFLKYADFFRMYITYLKGYELQVETINKLKKDSKKFAQLLERTKAKLEEGGGLDLFSYLIMPVQRIPRYVMLLRELQKNSVSCAETDQALVKMSEIAAAINEKQGEVENASRVMLIQEKLKGFNEQLVTPHRRLIKEGLVGMVATEASATATLKAKQSYLYLFSDLVLVTGQSGKTFKCKFTPSATTLESLTEPPTDFSLTDSKNHMVFRVEDEAQRKAWLELIAAEIASTKAQRQNRVERRKDMKSKKPDASSGATIHSKLKESLENLANNKTLTRKGGDSEESQSRMSLMHTSTGGGNAGEVGDGERRNSLDGEEERMSVRERESAADGEGPPEGSAEPSMSSTGTLQRQQSANKRTAMIPSRRTMK